MNISLLPNISFIKVNNSIHLFIPTVHLGARNGWLAYENRIHLIKLTKNEGKKKY